MADNTLNFFTLMDNQGGIVVRGDHQSILSSKLSLTARDRNAEA